MNIMEVKNVKKVYGSKNGGSESNALNGVSFSVAKGEFLGSMGPSGAGKSTLLNVISTIDSPTGGTISIGGKSFSNLNEDELSLFRRKQLGFIFQDYNFLDTLTLKENIILPLSLSKEDVTSMEAKLKKISSILNIEDILGKYPYEVYIKIEDNGKGMAEEEVEKLFERYYRDTNSAINVKFRTWNGNSKADYRSL